MTPKTKGGERLLASIIVEDLESGVVVVVGEDGSWDFPLDPAAAIAAIEVEAARLALAGLCTEVEELSCVFGGPALRLEGFGLARAAVLDLIDKAMEATR